jgi:hypothetical protein
LPRGFLGVNRMIDVPIISSAVYPKMRSALGFGKAEKANRSLDIDGRSLPLTWPNVWEKYSVHAWAAIRKRAKASGSFHAGAGTPVFCGGSWTPLATTSARAGVDSSGIIKFTKRKCPK